ncbi:MAG: LPS-assembly protein LptD, partial [Bacteroidales bacterium]|nr:LPS-assembly protein LptD [Bacteroidales bacterium]
MLTLIFLLAPLCLGRTIYAKPSTTVYPQDSFTRDSFSEDSFNQDTLRQDLLVQDTLSQIPLAPDSLAQDSLPSDSLSTKPEGGGLTAVVNYKAQDSLVFAAGNMAWLYGSSQVTYTDIQLDAERIQLSLDSSLVHANGVPDSITGKLNGKPVFKDNSGEYETRTMSYNFKTAKGFICDVTSQQGEGYVTGGTTKKMPNNDIYLENGRYTTCDQTECPHFYIELTKGRLRPNKNIVTGPAYLVVADVPLPIAIPFGYFPFTKSYSSGILMPTYGTDQAKGLYLRDGGYYFAINDYVDLAVRGDIYTKGSWQLSTESRYAIRYKFKGNFAFSYNVAKTGDKGLPDYVEQKNMKLTWSHSQDSRFNPNLSLSANVNFTTSGYERSNTTSVYSNDLTTSTKQSTINAGYKIPNTKWNMTASTSITQRTTDSTLVVTLPQFTASMSTWYPFKRKQKSGSDRWYEKISMTYNMNMSNKITAKESEFGQ